MFVMSLYFFFSFLVIYFFRLPFSLHIAKIFDVCLFASRFRGVQFVLLFHVIDDLLKHNGNSGVMKEAISQKRTFELPSKIITVDV